MKKESQKNLVRYDNNFNMANLTTLSDMEWNVFITVCARFSDRKRSTVQLSTEELQQAAKFTKDVYGKKRFIDILDATIGKVLTINFSFIDNEGWKEYRPLFRLFRLDPSKTVVDAELDDVFYHYFYNFLIGKGFSQFEYERFIDIKSKYGKTLFRHLLQHYYGFWRVPIEDYRKIIGYPKSYSGSKIIQQTRKLFPILEETGYMSNIALNYQKSDTRGSPITDLIFTFEISKEKQAEISGQQKLQFSDVMTQKSIKQEAITEDNKQGLPVLKGFKQTFVDVPATCPKCHAPLLSYAKKDGTLIYFCKNSAYFHKYLDGDGKCNFHQLVTLQK